MITEKLKQHLKENHSGVSLMLASIEINNDNIDIDMLSDEMSKYPDDKVEEALDEVADPSVLVSESNDLHQTDEPSVLAVDVP